MSTYTVLTQYPLLQPEMHNNIKIMLISFFIQRVSYVQKLILHGQRRILFDDNVQHLKVAVRKNWLETWISNSWMVHHDKAPTCVIPYLLVFGKYMITVVLSLPILLTWLLDFFLFCEVKWTVFKQQKSYGVFATAPAYNSGN